MAIFRAARRRTPPDRLRDRVARVVICLVLPPVLAAWAIDAVRGDYAPNPARNALRRVEGTLTYAGYCPPKRPHDLKDVFLRTPQGEVAISTLCREWPGDVRVGQAVALDLRRIDPLFGAAYDQIWGLRAGTHVFRAYEERADLGQGNRALDSLLFIVGLPIAVVVMVVGLFSLGTLRRAE
jgi:hypothetical protein